MKRFILQPLSVSLSVIRFENRVLRSAVRGQAIGCGSGPSSGSAKQAAAEQALEYLNTLPEKHPLLSTQ